MKKLYFLIILTFLIIVKIGNCQSSYMSYFDFEINNYYEDTLFIDTLANPNNVWEIGTPNKLIFQSAYSLPNAIVTKLDTVYPINDTSSFIIVHIADMSLNNFGVMWIDAQYKTNTDTLLDYGTIEFSPDNGQTWIDLLTDTLYTQQNIFDWGGMKPNFTGNSNGWKWLYLWIQDDFHIFNITYGDTVLFKFTFISDSIQTFKDGWMLDNIKINDYWMNIPEYINENINFSIYPNPTTGVILISNDGLQITDLAVFDIYGKEVFVNRSLSLSKCEIDLSQQPKGIYIIKLRTDKGVAVEKVVLE